MSAETQPSITVDVTGWVRMGGGVYVGAEYLVPHSNEFLPNVATSDTASSSLGYDVSSDGKVAHVESFVDIYTTPYSPSREPKRSRTAIILYDEREASKKGVALEATFEPPIPDGVWSDTEETEANGGEPVKRTMTIRRVQLESAE